MGMSSATATPTTTTSSFTSSATNTTTTTTTTTTTISSIFGIIMGVPDVVKEKIGEIKDLGALDRDGLAAAVKEYYDLSCATFSERFDIEHQVMKNDMEIPALEMEVNDMHGKFIIPKLKKVRTFQLTSGEE